MASTERIWSVAKATVEGKPIIYKFIADAPPLNIQQKMPWLTVISWKYEASGNNGLPPAQINKEMIRLEDGLETIGGNGTLYLDAYTATGNGLKEFVYYIADREAFMANVNEALSDHPVYPIEINFYEDRDWSDLAKLHQSMSTVH
ncbi:Family of uncharacterised function (DUF695) [Ectopseudomonas mendocina]|jgi:hypothetical protein|uniref:DUF695 domain-containing protein n=3 Tax=Pseudomonadales TaxID=72274 RepID=A0ABD7RV47_ECTME|nr:MULTISPECIES: DUF695 domain-containing protein [Pseudomonas aeruginosa group]ALN18602.1 hypothetical protein DW68_008155 [Pseudomonas mendocina S5.2]KES00547.1 hypothetical protein HN51_12060 [Pseudomonas mendocina]TRO11419.1 DUF695 domain-containing protein [Pseudomonas mendocina]TRO16735.1 DUF695 domain-containing protein [Pseudomonas mendocina]SUD34167.1 Family of uncharacterised function (DUF695) [Pseudomonas mendocina]